MEAIGIDIGGVIIERLDAHRDTAFLAERFLDTPAVAGAFESIRDIVESRFGANAYLVSKCGPKVQSMTLQWLEARQFFRRTAIVPGNVRFCRERRHKASICDALGITHFVDDRLEVLSCLTTVANRYLFQPLAAEVEKFAGFRGLVREFGTWNELRRELISR